MNAFQFGQAVVAGLEKRSNKYKFLTNLIAPATSAAAPAATKVVSRAGTAAPSWVRNNQAVARGLNPATGLKPGAVAPAPPPPTPAPKITISPAEAAAGRAKMTISPAEAAAGRAKVTITPDDVAAARPPYAAMQTMPSPALPSAAPKIKISPAEAAAGRPKMTITPAEAAAGRSKMTITPDDLTKIHSAGATTAPAFMGFGRPAPYLPQARRAQDLATRPKIDLTGMFPSRGK